jgi:polar amino acid transport system permease protein
VSENQTAEARQDMAEPQGMSPRRRAQLVRTVQYVVLIAIILVLAIKMDWPRIGNRMFNLQVIGNLMPRLPLALLNTLKYTAGAFVIGITGGLLLALMKLSSVGPYRWIAHIYTEFFRGIPALVVVLSVGFGVPMAFGIKIPSIWAKIAISLGVISAAYVSETIRAGLQAVPKGQVEAARSLGMSHTSAMIHVVIPQALRIVLPPLTNEFIMLTKDTSLVYALGLMVPEFELTKLGQDSLNSAQAGLTGMVVVGVAYLVITIPLGFLARHLEKVQQKRSA